MASYISKIKVPGVEAVYLIKDNEGRLMIAKAYSSSTPYSVDDYYVKEGYLWKVTTGGTGAAVTGATTSVANELKSIKQSIAGAMHYIGVTLTPLTDGSTITTLTPWPDRPNSLTKTSGFIAGDVVLAPVNDEKATEMFHEFVWNGYEWSRFGSINPIGKMAYANTATGTTTITYNKSVYTGGTVSVKEYSEGVSKYLNKNTVVSTVNVNATTSASSVLKTTSKLGTTSVSVVDGTGAAVTNITTTQKGLATTSIYGVEENTFVVSKVENGTTSVQVGATQTTSVVTRTGTTAPASGSNPFVGAQVDDNDECLSWIEEPIGTTNIREAVAMEISVPEAKITNISGIAKKAATGTTVATGELSVGGSGIITDVTSTTEEFAKKAASDVVVATGAFGDTGPGADVISDITITEVKGLVTGITYTENDGVLVEGTSGADAIKVLTGITSADAEKKVTLIQGTDATEDVSVTITVNPD